MRSAQYSAGSRYSHPDPNAARHALKRPASTAARSMSMLRVLTALEELRKGSARREEFHDLSDIVNIIDALASMGKIEAEPAMRDVIAAQHGMVHAMRSHEATGRMEMPDQGYAALCSLARRYEQAVERFAGRTFQEAAQHLYRRLAEHQANPQAGVVVVG